MGASNDATLEALLKAMSRADFVHPECPVGCQPVSDWWANYLTVQGLNPEELCVLDDAFYKVDPSTLTKYFTCVANGETYSQCDNQNLVCSGFSAQGLVTFGWPAAQKSALVLALSQADG